MRILLINPSLVQAEIGHYSKETEKNRGVYPPLGLCYIASVLEKNGHGVKIVDCDAEKDYWNIIESTTKEFQPDVVGFYIMTWTFVAANDLAKKIKEIKSNIKLIVGGPGVTCMPRESLEYGVFDLAVISEGEVTVVELVKALEKGKGNFSDILGLAYKEKGEVKINNPRPLIENLDSIPFPARHLLPSKDRYFDVFTIEKHFATVIATRGCPFNCSFCDRKNRMGKNWRVRSPQNLIDEVEKIYKEEDIREFMFFDDNFIVRKQWVSEVCDEILKRRLKIVWECRSRVDTINEEVLSKMKKAGCYRIRFGFEAGDNRILKVLNKGITKEQSIKCAKICKKIGMEMVGYFMMGSPEETKETIQKTLDLALEIDPAFAVFSKTIIIPGTELFLWAIANNQIDSKYWDRFMKGKEKDGAPSLDTKELPEKEVTEFVKMANKKFYIRSSYMIRRLFSIRSFTQLWRQLNMGKALILNKFS
ncbi:MAG: radical SAM protein [Candidatus Zambryskibacteria bacterium]|nr:radical SAM protein [Candidatus Zambryskibacteria bacterium]